MATHEAQPSPAEQPFNITVENTLSLQDLASLDAQGYSVVRSSHVGNQYPSNLAWIQEGGRAVWYDRTLASRDNNYYPHLHVASGESHSLYGTHDQLTTHAVVETPPPGYEDLAGESATSFHLQGLARAYPLANVLPYEGYLLKNQPEAAEILDILHRGGFRHYFNRFVHSDGHVEDVSAIPDAPRHLTVGEHADSDRVGFIPANEVNVALFGVLEALRSGRTTQYHLSGPDMIGYAAKMQPELSAMYATVRRAASFRAELPDHIHMKVVPSAAARFLVRHSDGEALDALFDTHGDMAVTEDMISAEAADYFGPDATITDEAKRKAFVERKHQVLGVTRKVFDEALVHVMPAMTGPGEPSFPSQYDAVYMRPENRLWKLSDLQHLYKTMTKRYKALQKGK